MTVEAFAQHLERPCGHGHLPEDACTGAAGGAACGDLVRISLTVDPQSPQGSILDAGFDASGCGAAQAAGSATVALVRGRPLLDAARVGAERIAAELGGLSPAKRHAAELAADALHRALGLAARRQARLVSTSRRTLVAMSGGVDSAVAALLAAEEDGEVAAVTLELWSDPHNDASRSCCSLQAVRYARLVAHEMGLAHLSIDLREEFKAGVVDGWLADHAAGLTPNPCVRCNGRVRIDAMIDLADRLGAQTLATGHYARLVEGPLLRVARDEAKDQSYALAALAPSSLERLRFPLGELTKAQVRERAELAGLAVARRPDSQDLCFLAGTDRDAFLTRHAGLQASPGAILDLDGRQLGRHQGLHTVTVGQRRGLGLAGGPPLFVLAVDPTANTVTVGPREGLLDERVSVRDVTLHRRASRVDAVKLRYRGRRIACRLAEELAPGRHDRVEALLVQATERTAAGQVACFYAGETIVGHGTILARPVRARDDGAQAGPYTQRPPAAGALAL
jgi:tRNA-uridine 2-sulfurtransferase